MHCLPLPSLSVPFRDKHKTSLYSHVRRCFRFVRFPVGHVRPPEPSICQRPTNAKHFSNLVFTSEILEDKGLVGITDQRGLAKRDTCQCPYVQGPMWDQCMDSGTSTCHLQSQRDLKTVNGVCPSMRQSGAFSLRPLSGCAHSHSAPENTYPRAGTAHGSLPSGSTLERCRSD